MENLTITIMCLGAMLIGVLFSYFYPKGNYRRDRATIVFVLAAAILLVTWLLKEPNIVMTLEDNIGWVLLGLVITFLQLIPH